MTRSTPAKAAGPSAAGLSALAADGCTTSALRRGANRAISPTQFASSEAGATRSDGLPASAACSLSASRSESTWIVLPSLKTNVVHPSAASAERPAADGPAALAGVDLVITSYGFLSRAPWLGKTAWRLAIIDEAQAIKNPGAKQTRAVKQIQADARIALTGTPIENRLGDLWSIFDFINPGLLGSARQFSSFAKQLAEREHNPYGPLRELVRPYILRRLKTDKSIIADLPDKTEVNVFCSLSRKQAALYQQAVRDMAHQLEEADRSEEHTSELQ